MEVYYQNLSANSEDSQFKKHFEGASINYVTQLTGRADFITNHDFEWNLYGFLGYEGGIKNLGKSGFVMYGRPLKMDLN